MKRHQLQGVFNDRLWAETDLMLQLCLQGGFCIKRARIPESTNPGLYERRTGVSSEGDAGKPVNYAPKGSMQGPKCPRTVTAQREK